MSSARIFGGGHSGPDALIAEQWQRVVELEKVLDALVAAANPYIELAAPHEQLFSGEDLANYTRLGRALSAARDAKPSP